ncbi:MAG: tetratricopeptide repeat protein [Sandaracinaceae bacterium]
MPQPRSRSSLGRLVASLALLGVALAPLTASAQEAGGATPPPGDGAAGSASSSTEREGTALSDYYDAMVQRRLLSRESGSESQLRDMIREGERLYLDDRFEEAQRVLYEAVESPRFRDFDSLDEYRQAEFMLAGALYRMGALRSAWRYLERILERGPDDPYFGPAYRRAVDVALAGADLTGAIQRLSAVAPAESLAPDSANEFLYLEGRERYDVQDWEGASRFFEQVGRQSRFYANARYLQGVIATQAGRLEDAEGHFCAIATTPDTDSFTFFVDRRYFEIRDLTWLALGRIAHEARRPDDAFYYYFQVPQDSARVSEALFEAAWAMYEGDDHDTASDLLDQLEARFPDSPYVHEAAVLRGYIHLARCDFEDADEMFRGFQSRFTPVVHEIDRILSSESRQSRLFEELLAAENDEPLPATEGEAPGEGGELPVDVHALLLSLLTVDPNFFQIWSEVRTLDAEAARSGQVPDQLGALAARLEGSDSPRPADAEIAPIDEADALRSDLEGARAVLRALDEQIDAMRQAGAQASQLAPLEQELAGLGRRVGELEARVGAAERSSADAQPVASADRGGIEGMLSRDRRAANAFGSRVADVRGRMVVAANERALRSLRRLRHDLGGLLRRSRIGRIDAVMGSKRRIEIQIESLAAGRFPPELQDPLSVQGLLRDDEEYWPFEGEYWQDEFEEDAADEEGLDEDDLGDDTGDDARQDDARQDEAEAEAELDGEEGQ